MFLLHSILLVSVITVSYQELSTTPDIPDTQSLQPTSRAVLRDEIQDLKNKFNQQNTIIAQQNTKIDQQNSKLAEQDIKILYQNTKIQDLERKIEELGKGDGGKEQPPIFINSTSKESGSIFIKWGRRDCPRNVSQLVYSGFAGGSYYAHTGAAADHVCLPPDPMWNVNKHFHGRESGYMYGTEYEHNPRPIQNYKVPCAVCRSSHLSTVIMIPARTDCYQGWQKAYNGELASGLPRDPAATQYICLDEHPQTSGTNSNLDGYLIYPVRAKCGSLPCPPYEDNTLLTCVVCLK